MDFFTRAWASGELSDNEFDRVLADYQTYLGSLDSNSSAYRFATSIGLNTAWVDRFSVNSDQLSIRLLTGDLQRGYWLTSISYEGASGLIGT